MGKTWTATEVAQVFVRRREPGGTGPAEIAGYIRQEMVARGELVKLSGIVAQD